MPYVPRRATKGRRVTKASNGVAGRRERAAGTLTVIRVLHQKSTRLRVVNAPNIMSRRRTSQAVGRIHGFKTVNAPGSGRVSASSSSSVHRVNAPKGLW